jgi:hypothetical protein
MIGPNRSSPWIGLAALLALPAAACTTEARCIDGISTELACGLNDRGNQMRVCVDGSWTQPGVCHDPDVCVDGISEPMVCGINDRGAQTRSCVAGAWRGGDACEDSDVCLDDSVDSSACGLNDRGTQTRTCVAGAWSTPGCVDPDECVDETIETAPCGLLGSQTRQCTLGHWGPLQCVEPIFIAVPGRLDLVHDALRGRVYITTHDRGGEVMSYNLANRQFEAPLLTGGLFMGVDLSPDENHLIVADASRAPDHSRIYRIDLTTGAVQKISFALNAADFLDSGTFSVVFTSGTEALVSSRFGGSGTVPLRRVDLITGTSESIRTVNQDTMLVVSADRSTVVCAESNNSGGPVLRYDVDTQSFTSGRVDTFLHEIAVAPAGSQLAVPAGHLHFFDSSLVRLASIGGPGDRAVGAVYSPIRDEIYVAWKSNSRSLDVYSPTTLRKLRDVAPIPGLFMDFDRRAFEAGRLRVSRDGTLLLASTTGGVAIYPAGPTGL